MTPEAAAKIYQQATAAASRNNSSGNGGNGNNSGDSNGSAASTPSSGGGSNSSNREVKICFGPSRPPATASSGGGNGYVDMTSSSAVAAAAAAAAASTSGAASSANLSSVSFGNFDLATLKESAAVAAAAASVKPKGSSKNSNSNNGSSGSNKKKNGLPCSEAEMKALMSMFVEIMGMSMDTDKLKNSKNSSSSNNNKKKSKGSSSSGNSSGGGSGNGPVFMFGNSGNTPSSGIPPPPPGVVGWSSAAAAAAALDATGTNASSDHMHNHPMAGLFSDGVGAASWEAIRRTYGRSTGGNSSSSNRYRHNSSSADSDYGHTDEDFEDDDFDDDCDDDDDSLPDLDDMRDIIKNEQQLLLKQHLSQQPLGQDSGKNSAVGTVLGSIDSAAAASTVLTGTAGIAPVAWESIEKVVMDDALEAEERARKAAKKRKEKKQRKKQKQKEEAAQKAAEAAQKKRDKAILSWRSRVVSAVQSNELLKLESLLQESPLSRNHNTSSIQHPPQQSQQSDDSQIQQQQQQLQEQQHAWMMPHLEFLLPNAVAKNRNQVERGKDSRERLTQYILSMDMESVFIRPLRNGRPALHSACFHGDLNFVTLVLDKVESTVIGESSASAKTETTDDNDATATTKPPVSISDHVNLNFTCQDSGWSPLHYAVVSGSNAILEQLLARGCDVTTVSDETHTWRESDGEGITAKELAQYVHSGEYEQKIESHGVALQEMANAFFSSSSERRKFLKTLEQMAKRLSEIEVNGYFPPNPAASTSANSDTAESPETRERSSSMAGSDDGISLEPQNEGQPDQQQQSHQDQQPRQQETASSRKRKKKKKKKEAQKAKNLAAVAEASKSSSTVSDASSQPSVVSSDKAEEDPMVTALLGMGFTRDQIMAAAKACGGTNRATADDLVAWIFGQESGDTAGSNNNNVNSGDDRQDEAEDDSAFEVNATTVVKTSQKNEAKSSAAEAKRLEEEEARKKEEAAQRLAAKREETRRRNREWNNREQARQQEEAKAKMAKAMAAQQRAPVPAPAAPSNFASNPSAYPSLQTGLPNGLQTGMPVNGMHHPHHPHPHHHHGGYNKMNMQHHQTGGLKTGVPVSSNNPSSQKHSQQRQQHPHPHQHQHQHQHQQPRHAASAQPPSNMVPTMMMPPHQSRMHNNSNPTPAQAAAASASAAPHPHLVGGTHFASMQPQVPYQNPSGMPHAEQMMLPPQPVMTYAPPYGFPPVGADDDKTVSSYGSSRVSVGSNSYGNPTPSIPPPGFRPGSTGPSNSTSNSSASSSAKPAPAMSKSIEEESSGYPPITTDVNPLGEIRATAKAFVPSNFTPPVAQHASVPEGGSAASGIAGGNNNNISSNMQMGLSSSLGRYGASHLQQPHSTQDIVVPSLSSFVDNGHATSATPGSLPSGMHQLLSGTGLASSSFDHGTILSEESSPPMHASGHNSNGSIPEPQQQQTSTLLLDSLSGGPNSTTAAIGGGASIWGDSHQLGLPPPASSSPAAAAGVPSLASGLPSFSFGDVAVGAGGMGHNPVGSNEQHQHHLQGTSLTPLDITATSGDGNSNNDTTGLGLAGFGGVGQGGGGWGYSDTTTSSSGAADGNNNLLHRPPSNVGQGSIW